MAEGDFLDDRRRASEDDYFRKQDRELVEQMTKRIQELFPHSPPDEARAVARHTAVRGSGRVGRTAAGRALSDEALTLAVIAGIRHNHTDYDAMLAQGLDRALARDRVAGRLDEILRAWRTMAPPS